jgi:two-component system chemotaxis response regulator CheY
MIVDDSRFVAHSMQAVMEDLQFQVVGVAYDGLQALDAFDKLAPDITLLDITMPNMDGVECLAKIKERSPDACVIMLSAVQDKDTIAKCVATGAAGFLQKPIRRGNTDDIGRLFRVIEQAMGRVTI